MRRLLPWLLSGWLLLPSMIVAQAPTPYCAPNGESPCPLPPERMVRASLSESAPRHRWALVVPTTMAVRIRLDELREDYRLSLFTWEGRVVDISNRAGQEDEEIVNPGLAPGRYILVVDSATPRLNPTPYRLQWTGAGPFPEPPSTVAGGQLLLVDRMDDPQIGWLATGAETRGIPPGIALGYEDGEYVVRRVDPSPTGNYSVWTPGVLADVAIAADVRVIGEVAGRGVGLVCRVSEAGGYALVVGPDQTFFGIIRWDTLGPISLFNYFASPTIQAGDAVNHLELACVGDRLAVWINGQEAASVQDGTHHEGRVGLQVGTFDDARPGPVEARFDNLVVTTLSGGVAEASPPILPR